MKPETLKVRCGEHGPVPHPGQRPQIDEDGKATHCIHHEDGVVEVPNTMYFRRRIARGELVDVGGEE